MPKKSVLITYLNGFIGRFHNRRIQCLIRKDGDYDVTFIKFSKEKYLKKDLKHFDKYIKKMGGYITYKHLRLSEEALFLLADGFITYKERNP